MCVIIYCYSMVLWLWCAAALRSEEQRAYIRLAGVVEREMWRGNGPIDYLLCETIVAKRIDIYIFEFDLSRPLVPPGA